MEAAEHRLFGLLDRVLIRKAAGDHRLHHRKDLGAVMDFPRQQLLAFLRLLSFVDVPGDLRCTDNVA
jgi:hypothetical protein